MGPDASPTDPRTEFFLKHCPQTPHPKQWEFVKHDARELFWGGGTAGGKTSGALMLFLWYAWIPGFAMLCLRRNYQQMTKPDAVMSRAHEWWYGKPGAHWDRETHTYKFECPGGGESMLAFGHMEDSLSHHDYQGARPHIFLFEEVTQFATFQYEYMFTRQRVTHEEKAAGLPLLARSTGNPDGIGREWVYNRFINPETRRDDCVWMPSIAEDNLALDMESYETSMGKLDPVSYARMRKGDWGALEPGDFFDQSNFVLVQEKPANLSFMRKVRYWDFASSEVTKKRKDPDYTASCLMAYAPGARRGEEIYYILDITEDRWDAGVLPDMVRLQAVEDGKGVIVRWEQEGGSAGAIASERAIKPALSGFDCDGIRSTGSKANRAKPLAAKVSGRRVYVVENPRTKRFLDQCHRFPAVEHDDMVDATSGAFNWLLEHSAQALKGEAARSQTSRNLDEYSELDRRRGDERGGRVRRVRGPLE